MTIDSRPMDSSSGFDRLSGIYRSLRRYVSLPPDHHPLSVADHTLSLLSADVTDTTFIVSASTGHSLTYGEFLSQIRSLAASLKDRFSFSRNDVAFILLPSSIHVPVIFFALMSLGVVISPANPIGSDSEVTHQVRLSKPVVAFATSQTARKIPPSSSLRFRTVLVDSPEFISWLNRPGPTVLDPVRVNHLDTAAILYSSGTTGRVKGVLLSHRNLIAIVEGFYQLQPLDAVDGLEQQPPPHPVSLFPLPLFHVFGFTMLLRQVALGETLVLMERFDFEAMLRAVEKYRVNYMPVSPPLIVAMIKSELTNKYDISSLLKLGCGGAPLGKEVAERFREKFPNVDILQGYGLTESGGSGTRMVGPDEHVRYGSVGRLAENIEAKIVDPETGEALPPGKRGELWLRGPVIMQGYLGDDKATTETLDPEGWLKTGDLCYFDSEGFLYIVDRLKELIKYKAYQVPPAELETVLQSHPEVADAAVVPLPDEEAGQIPMAFLVRKPGSNISEAQIIEFVAKQVAPYKKIRRVAFINAIPKNPSGKILRRELTSLAISSNSSKL